MTVSSFGGITLNHAANNLVMFCNLLCLDIIKWIMLVCVCSSDDVAKAVVAKLSLGGRRLHTVVTDRKILKQKQTTYSSDTASVKSQ